MGKFDDDLSAELAYRKASNGTCKNCGVRYSKNVLETLKSPATINYVEKVYRPHPEKPGVIQSKNEKRQLQFEKGDTLCSDCYKASSVYSEPKPGTPTPEYDPVNQIKKEIKLTNNAYPRAVDVAANPTSNKPGYVGSSFEQSGRGSDVTINSYYLVGPKHSPAYLASCNNHIKSTNNDEPHPDALGTLPAQHTIYDLAHYALARGGQVHPDGSVTVDLRTPEQRDPNNRAYTDAIGPVKINAPKLHVKTEEKQVVNRKLPGGDLYNTEVQRTIYTLPPKATQSNNTIIRTISAEQAKTASPEELALHRNHDWHLQNPTRATHDQAYIPWRSDPDSCRLCAQLEAPLRKRYDHAGGLHTNRVDQACPDC